MDEELKALKSKFSEFNIERLNGADRTIDEIINALSSAPMLGGTRLVMIESLEYEEKDEGKLFGTLQNLDPAITAVFVNYDGVDKRRKFYKLMEKIAEVKEFKRFTEWEQDKTLAWIVGRVKSYGKKIGAHAADLLIEIVGPNLRMLDKEIEKISTYIGERSLIEEQDVSSLASSGEMDAFSLSNAIRDKNTKEAMQSLGRLFRDNQDPHMLIGMLAKLYRMLLQVKCLEEKGMGQYDIARELNAKPFFVKKCMEKTNAFSQKEISRNIKLLHAADLKMKSGANIRLTMEMLIPELCNGQ